MVVLLSASFAVVSWLVSSLVTAVVVLVGGLVRSPSAVAVTLLTSFEASMVAFDGPSLVEVEGRDDRGDEPAISVGVVVSAVLPHL